MLAAKHEVRLHANDRAIVMNAVFSDREEAGRELGRHLSAFALTDPVVLALPRGGVPIGAEVARALHAPLDLLMVRKIGAPWHPELAVAAVVDGASPQLVIDDETFAASGADRAYVDEAARRELKEIERRRALYMKGRSPMPLAGKSVVVVDDGIATGTTVRAALKALRQQRVARLVLAVPVGPIETVRQLRRDVDDLVCLMQPEFFQAVGYHYRDFHQVDDEEVMASLEAAGRRQVASRPAVAG